MGNERVFRCTTAGTSGSSEPAWNLANNATTTSGTAVFTQIGGQEAEQVAGNWKAPLARLQSVWNIATGATDVVYISQDHAETQSTAMTLGYTSGGTGQAAKVFCVNRAAGSSLPPVSADLRTTASITTTGTQTITLRANGSMYYYGIQFHVGTGTSGANFVFGNSSNFPTWNVLDSSFIELATTSNNSAIQLDAGSTKGTETRGQYADQVQCQRARHFPRIRCLVLV